MQSKALIICGLLNFAIAQDVEDLSKVEDVSKEDTVSQAALPKSAVFNLDQKIIDFNYSSSEVDTSTSLLAFPYVYNPQQLSHGVNASQFIGLFLMSAGSGNSLEISYDYKSNYELNGTSHPNMPLEKPVNFRDSVGVSDPQVNSVGTFLVGSVFYFLGSRP